MITIKCTCGEPECKIKLMSSGHQIWITDKDGEETLMHMDANAAIELFRMARYILESLQQDAAL